LGVRARLRGALGSPHGYPADVGDAPRLISADELDAMSPDERSRVVREHVVTNLDELPEDFRPRVETTAARLAQQGLRPATG
jgi:hypothetical protein